MPGGGGPPTAEQLEVSVAALRTEAELWEDLAAEYNTLAADQEAYVVETESLGFLGNAEWAPGLATAYHRLYNNVFDCLGLAETEFRAIAETLRANADKYDETEAANEEASSQVTSATSQTPSTGGPGGGMRAEAV